MIVGIGIDIIDIKRIREIVEKFGDKFYERITTEKIADILNDKPSDATVKRVHAPHPKERRIVFQNIDREGWSNDIATYLLYGGYDEQPDVFATPGAMLGTGGPFPTDVPAERVIIKQATVVGAP